jgi:dTMP kinase
MSELAEKLAGAFIVIDGPDGAGKSTQTHLLAEHLKAQGLAVCLARDPGGTVIGEKVRRILLDASHQAMAPATETMLFMASRAQLADEVIRPALSTGQCVLCERYVSATIAYQGAAGMDAPAIRAVAEVAVGGLWPYLTIILDLPADEGLARVPNAHDRMEAKGPDFHRRVRELFLAQARQDPRRFVVVDARGTVDAVQQRLRQAVEDWAARGGTGGGR